MKIYSIVLLIICINCAIKVTSDFGLVDTYPTSSVDFINGSTMSGNTTYGGFSAEQMQGQQYLGQQVSTTNNFGFGDIIKSMFYLLWVLVWGIFLVPLTFMTFGVPTQLAVILSAPIYLVYLIGIAQFLRGTGLEFMS